MQTTATARDDDLACRLVAAEREVAGRRARDNAARLVATATVVDVFAVLTLLAPWFGRTGTPSGLVVDTGVGLVTVALRQVVLRAAAAAPDASTYRVVYLVAALSSLAGVLLATWIPFAVVTVISGVLAGWAARRMQEAVVDVDLLAGTFVRDPGQLMERLDAAVTDALRHGTGRGRRRPPAAPGAMTRQVGGRTHDEHPGARGVASRLAGSAAVLLLCTVPCILLLCVFAYSADHPPGVTRVPLLPAVLGPLAVFELVRPAARPGSFRRTRNLVFALLVGAAAAALAAVRCLTEVAAHVPSRLPPGPAPWLATLGFGYGLAAALALLAASALYQPARRNRRQRAELARAQERIASAAPAWPAR